jgi:3-hydroxyisobutyrate dehydrogenase-like beta-hydroxyacid dehydrogenase
MQPSLDTATGLSRPIGVIGLGAFGRAIAERLKASGLRVLCYDGDELQRQSIAGSPLAADLASSLFDLGDGADVVLSTLADADALKAALLGDVDRPGVGASLRTGSIVVHFGSGPHDVVLKLTGLLGSRGIGLVDVFTCHGIPAAIEGRMELLAGGHAAIVDRARPALAPLGSVERIGQTGAATGLGALRGYVRAARLIALSEAMLIGSHAGISRDVLARVFDGAIASGPQSRRLAGMAPSQFRPAPLLIDTFRAVQDAVEFGDRIGLSGDGVAFARDVLADALETTGESADETALLCHLSEVAADEA